MEQTSDQVSSWAPQSARAAGSRLSRPRPLTGPTPAAWLSLTAPPGGPAPTWRLASCLLAAQFLSHLSQLPRAEGPSHSRLPTAPCSPQPRNRSSTLDPRLPSPLNLGLHSPHPNLVPPSRVPASVGALTGGRASDPSSQHCQLKEKCTV